MHPAPKVKNTAAADEEKRRLEAEEGNAGTVSTFNFYGSSAAFKCNSARARESSQNAGGAAFPFCWDRFVSSDATPLDRGPGTPLSSGLEPFSVTVLGLVLTTSY